MACVRRGPYCPRPRRVVRRAMWKARLRAALSVLGVIAVLGAAAGGFWVLREPVAAAVADVVALSPVKAAIIPD